MAKSLAKIEQRIEENVKKAWYENGLLLLEIQEDKLYKKKHETFEDYLKNRWEMKKSRGYQLIESAKNYQLLENNVHKNDLFVDKVLPKNEAQLRPLAELDDAEKVHVWNEVVKTTDKPTMKVVEQAVKEFKKQEVEVKPILIEDIKKSNVTSSKKEVLYANGNNDECYTPLYGVLPIIPHLKKLGNPIVWCPFDDEHSLFVSTLVKAGFRVVASHIADGQDFYDYEPEEWDVIVSNPPFTNKRGIFERALSFGKPFALVMSNTWLNDSAPKQLFKDKDLQLLMFDERMKFLNQDNSENKITFSSSYYCWNFLEKQIMMDSLKDYGYGK